MSLPPPDFSDPKDLITERDPKNVRDELFDTMECLKNEDGEIILKRYFNPSENIIRIKTTDDNRCIDFDCVKGYTKSKIMIDELTQVQKIFLLQNCSNKKFLDTCKIVMSSKLYANLVTIGCSNTYIMHISSDEEKASFFREKCKAFEKHALDEKTMEEYKLNGKTLKAFIAKNFKIK